jgi:hypothetical protein
MRVTRAALYSSLLSNATMRACNFKTSGGAPALSAELQMASNLQGLGQRGRGIERDMKIENKREKERLRLKERERKRYK